MRIALARSHRLASAWLSPVPLSSYILGVFDVGRVDLISVNTLLQLEVFFDVNKSLIHTLLAHLENAGIAFSRLP